MMHFLQWLLWTAGRWILNLLPYGLALAVGHGLGRLLASARRPARAALAREYRGMMPELSEREAMHTAGEAIALRVVNEVDYLMHERLNSDNIDELLPLEGEEHVIAARATGKGMLLTIFHFGCNFQIMPALGLRGHAVTQVALAWRPPGTRPPGRFGAYWARRVHEIQHRVSGKAMQASVVNVGNGGTLRPAVLCLKGNGILIVAADGEVGTMIDAPFFQYDAYPFARGAVALALRTGAPLHPVFVVRDARLRNHAVIEPELRLETNGSREDAERRNTLLVAKVLEKRVRAHPSHYGMELLGHLRRMRAIPGANAAPDA